MTTWKTVAVIPLPSAVAVTLRDRDGDCVYHAPVLLHQTGDDADRPERIVLGVLNTERAEIEPVDVDDDCAASLGALMRVHVPPPGAINSPPQRYLTIGDAYRVERRWPE